MTTPVTAVAERAVLDGVERCGFDKTASVCFAGATVVCMHYMGEQVTNEYVMGISGAAFKMFWIPPWSPANCDLLIIGEEPIQRTFTALGYDYRFVRDYDRAHRHARDFYRETIARSISLGVPVMAIGVVGPPEVCVLTGYEQGGDVVRGWSYFQESPDGYFSSADWYDNIHGLILIGQRQAQPTRREVLRNSLAWASDLARVPERCLDMPGGSTGQQCHSGLAAFDAMIAGLECDADFPAGNLDVLTSRSYALSNDGAWLMTDKRKAAAAFLKSMIQDVHPSAPDLWKAAELYAQESVVWEQAARQSPYSGAPSEVRLKWADPRLRREIACLVREAKVLEERAVDHLEQALEKL